MSEADTIEHAGKTHPGEVRAENEDSFAVLPSFGLFMVADGVGGHEAGEVASALALQVVEEQLRAVEPDWSTFDPPGIRAAQMLTLAVRFAHHSVQRAAWKDPTKRGMGTTFAGVLLRGGSVAMVHVGDSRIYRLREGRLEQLTVDHSGVNALAQLGRALPEDPDELDRVRHAITQALGWGRDLDIKPRVEDALPGDVLLLCSDGLTEVVPDDEIAALLSQRTSLEGACDALIHRTLEGGAPDNVTCVLVAWPEGAPEPVCGAAAPR